MSRGPNEASERLAAEWALLQRQWRDTTEQWRDEVRLSFEREFWQPHVEVTSATLDAMRELEEELYRAYARIRRR